MSYQFRPLKPTDQESLKTLQTYAQILGQVRKHFTPRRKHWFHAGLQVNATGLTTTIINVDGVIFELRLLLTSHRLLVSNNLGARWVTPINGQSPARFVADVKTALQTVNAPTDTVDFSQFNATDQPLPYNTDAVGRYWLALSQIDALFKQFRGELKEETGEVYLWPHHFDLAMLWFSGRLVPGQDPANEEYADEQLNFGFAPADSVVDTPYFYITAYPLPQGLTDTKLPHGAYWHTNGFTAAILPYNVLTEIPKPAEFLLTYLRTVQDAGAKLMRD